MSGKDEMTNKCSREVKNAAKQDYILRGQPALTTSATMPAYQYTSLCLDPALREPPVKRRQEKHAPK